MFSISNQRKHTNLNHLCFQNTVYKLDVSGYHGNGGDSLSYSNGAKFTTYDRDHDTGTKGQLISKWFLVSSISSKKRTKIVRFHPKNDFRSFF